MKKMLIAFCFVLFSLVNAQAQQCAAGYKHFSDTSFRVGDVILAPEILFDFNGPRVLYQSFDSVRIISVFMQKHPSFTIEIGVYTDYRGSSEYNDTLSFYRAKAIKAVMVYEFHSPPEQITVKGYGETEPIWTEEEIEAVANKRLQEELCAINRRVEVRIIGIN